MQKTLLLVSILMMASMASAASSDVPKPSQTPGDTFYFLDRFSESLELTVARAPVIGSPELEAKVRANHAAERLAEAQKLAESNRSEKVDSLMEEYSKQTNLSVQSAKKANNTNLTKRLGNVSDNHVKVLQNTQQKVPEQAQKGIQNAIENSQRNTRELGVPETAQDRGRPDIDTDLPLRDSNQTDKPGNPDTPVNKTVGEIQKKTGNSAPDQVNKTVPEEPVEEAVDTPKTENSSTRDTEDGLEEKVQNSSKTEDNVIEEPPAPGLP